MPNEIDPVALAREVLQYFAAVGSFDQQQAATDSEGSRGWALLHCLTLAQALQDLEYVRAKMAESIEEAHEAIRQQNERIKTLEAALGKALAWAVEDPDASVAVPGWVNEARAALAGTLAEKNARIKELEAEHSAACDFLDWCFDDIHRMSKEESEAFYKWRDAHKAACIEARAGVASKPE